MRSILLAVVFFGILPGAVIWPEVGVMLWTWLSYMNPHKMTYGFARNPPLTQLVALVTIGAWVLGPRPKRLPLDRTTVLFFALFLWFGVTTVLAFDRASAMPEMIEEVKKLLLGVMILALIDTRRRLLWLVGIMTLSLGFFGAQGGAYVLATGGSGLVVGPSGSYAVDNNGLAVVMIMALPLMSFFYLQAERTWQRAAIAGAVALTVISILGTHSRGGFLALSCCLVFLWWKTRRSLVGIIVLLLMFGAGLAAMPDEFYERLATLTVEQDDMDRSAVGRLEAWGHAVNIAASRPLVGAGFSAFSPEVFTRFTPDVEPRAAHSIYFQMLGEHGVVGLGLFLALLLTAYRNGGWLVRHAEGRPEAAWAGDLGRMLQVSLVGFTVGGAFLSIARIEPLWGIVLVSAVARRVALRERKAEEAAELQLSERASS